MSTKIFLIVSLMMVCGSQQATYCAQISGQPSQNNQQKSSAGTGTNTAEVVAQKETIEGVVSASYMNEGKKRVVPDDKDWSIDPQKQPKVTVVTKDGIQTTTTYDIDDPKKIDMIETENLESGDKTKETFTYDQNGELIRTVYESDDGISIKIVETFYKDGEPIKSVTSTYDSGSGKPITRIKIKGLDSEDKN